MKIFRFTILMFFGVLLLVSLPKNVRAGCCLCGDLNAGYQCYQGVQDCSLCGAPSPIFDPTCQQIVCSELTPAPAHVYENCCVYTGKVDKIIRKCTAVPDENSCLPGEFETERKEFFSQNCAQVPQCSLIGSRYTPQKKSGSGVVFKPQVTLPGSKFIAGQSITVTGSTLGEYIAAFYAFFVGAIAILATVMVFYGGVMWLMAGGNRGQVQNAKEQISSALIGLGIAFLAYLLLLTISPRLVKFSSLNLIFVKPVEQEISGEIAYGFKGQPLGTATLSATWLNDIKSRYGAFVTNAASDYGVSEDLIYAIIFIESGGTPNVSSPAGACGLMQLMPGTASQALGISGVSCSDLYNPEFNIQAGTAYLKKLLQDTCPRQAMRKDQTLAQCDPAKANCKNGELKYVIAAYNGGQGANCSSVDCLGVTWWECDKNKGYVETRDYVIKVQNALAQIINL